MCWGRRFRAIISLFSSLANSVMSSPFMSSSLVGKAVVNSVKFSVLIVFWVMASAFPNRAPHRDEKNISSMIKSKGHFFVFFIPT